MAALFLLALLNLAILGWNLRPFLAQKGLSVPYSSGVEAQQALATGTPSPTSSPTPVDPTDTAVPISLNDGLSPAQKLRQEGIMILSMRDGNNIHLFAYHPLYLPLSRITNQPWDDITPALSPDGTRIAYSSRQNGYWDLYILDLVSGKRERLTDTPEYEASPSWSPDGQWIAYEKNNESGLDIYLQSLTDPGSDPIALTQAAGINRSPAWSPSGREIAFISTRSGNEEIWLARLDKIDDRFINLSRKPESRDRSPAWSADGSRLSWASEQNGNRQLMIWDTDLPEQPARPAGEGDNSAWSPDGKILFSEVREPQASALAAYSTATGRLSLPLYSLPGPLYGMIWVQGPLLGWLAERVENPEPYSPQILWEPVMTRTVAPAGRMGLVAIEDVAAPQPLIHDAVDEAFIALRAQVAAEAGWDVLSSLENAYVALTTPPVPSIRNDWLYTGRAFAINPLLLSAGWVVITKEEFSGQVFWRVYLKARFQDGSMGMPLPEMVWDINARYNGDPKSYEDGGATGASPAGYWIDFTEITARYGWERLPSWTNWRTFFPSIRFNQFVITGGLDWAQAMAEMYPPEALQTPTSVPTVTLTATRTPKATRIPATSTPTPTFTLTPTRRATWTPKSP